MAEHNVTGKLGEALAVEALAGAGYAILERNWRCDHLEVDFIALKDDRVIFVEVKTRSNIDEDPLAAVTAQKMRRLVRAANAYLAQKKLPHEPQFDIVAISGDPESGEARVEHIRDAFFPPLRSY